MILQSLKKYYDRLAGSGEDDVPLFGFARQKIHFCLVLEPDGDPATVRVMDLRVLDGKKPRPVELIVPEPVIRSVQIDANFLWDNTGYVLGADARDKPDRALQAHDEFRKLAHRIGDGVDDAGMKAVLRFLDAWKPSDAPTLALWSEMIGQNLVFRLQGDRCFVHERPAVRAAWSNNCAAKAPDAEGMCLITGSEGSLARLHPAIKGVAGAQPSGAALISFNLDAFTSYGKDQNFNAPVGREAAFAYTTALNRLLSGGSRQKVRIGDTTLVFWAERETLAESLLAGLLDPQIQTDLLGAADDGAVKSLRVILEAARIGRVQDAVDEPDVPFYVLGLSPNAARLSVRFWYESTVGEIVRNIGRHFREAAIVKSYESDPEYPSAWQFLRETAPLGKSENISPLLAGAFMRSVLTGSFYPQNLLQTVLTRIRADQRINTLRASLIKACLIRNHNHGEIGMSLDSSSTNVGYRLGRLFAVLEGIQSEANRGISSTIRDKYFGSAAVTPQKIFPMLFGLAQQHLAKLRRDPDRKGFAVFFDKKIQEILSSFDASALPSFLNPENQGLFAIGYYHQRQDFFAGKPEQNEEE